MKLMPGFGTPRTPARTAAGMEDIPTIGDLPVAQTDVTVGRATAPQWKAGANWW
jgi:hypothetical protein